MIHFAGTGISSRWVQTTKPLALWERGWGEGLTLTLLTCALRGFHSTEQRALAQNPPHPRPVDQLVDPPKGARGECLLTEPAPP